MKLAYILIALAPSIALAQPGMMKNDSKRPVGAISRDLGITEEQFVECFSDVNPAPPGQHPSGERQHANKDILLPCLQKYNSSITNEKLDAVMDKYRPEGPN